MLETLAWSEGPGARLLAGDVEGAFELLGALADFLEDFLGLLGEVVDHALDHVGLAPDQFQGGDHEGEVIIDVVAQVTQSAVQLGNLVRAERHCLAGQTHSGLPWAGRRLKASWFRPFCGLTRDSWEISLLPPDLKATEADGGPPGVKSQRGSETALTEIKLKKGESVEKALRRLKKKIDREGTLKEVRNHRHYEKPSERRRRKMKMARFSAMLTARYADL